MYLHILIYSSQQICDDLTGFVLQTRTLRYRNIKDLAQGHTVSKGHRHSLYPGSLDVRSGIDSWDMSVAV